MASLHAEALMQLRPWKLWGSHSRRSTLEEEEGGAKGKGGGHGAVDPDTVKCMLFRCCSLCGFDDVFRIIFDNLFFCFEFNRCSSIHLSLDLSLF
jgi:hypothetical protein